MVAEYSVSPDGEKFQIPGPDDYEKESKRLQERAKKLKLTPRELSI